jgi:phospholipid/cholesterol/gamma-HCH transport system substrate-binding protein
VETRANNALIGLFTLAVIGAALGFVVWFARLSEGTAVNRYQIIFSGSITGLTVGSSVLFNGIRVGQVDTLDLLADDPSRVVAVVTVRSSTPIKVDTRARMEFQGLTGGAYIQLYGGSANAPALEPPPEQQMATIYAERSELQNLVDGARDTVTQAAQTLSRIDAFIRKNEGGLTTTVKNVETFTQALADNSGNVSNFLQTTGEAAKSISRLSDSLNGMAGDVEALIKAVDPAKIERVVDNVTGASDQLQAFVRAFDAKKAQDTIDNVEAFSRALSSASAPLTSFATDASALASRLSAMAPTLERSLTGLEKLTTSIDSEKIGRTVDNVEKFSATLGDNTAEVDAFLKDARKLSGDLAAMTPKLNAAFDSFNRVASAIDPAKLDRVVGNVDKFTATLAESSDRVKSFVDNAEKFSATLGNNSEEVDAFLKDARKLSGDLAAMTPKLNAAFDSFNRVAGALDPAKLDRVVANVDKFTATLGDSSGKVQSFIDDASALGKKLNATADRLDVILKDIEGMTSSPEGKGMFAEITETARSIRTLAVNLDTRTAELWKNLNQFAGPGLRDVRDFATDGQKTLRDIQRTLGSLNRNPQQLIFGPKSTIPEYRGK